MVCNMNNIFVSIQWYRQYFVSLIMVQVLCTYSSNIHVTFPLLQCLNVTCGSCCHILLWLLVLLFNNQIIVIIIAQHEHKGILSVYMNTHYLMKLNLYQSCKKVIVVLFCVVHVWMYIYYNMVILLWYTIGGLGITKIRFWQGYIKFVLFCSGLVWSWIKFELNLSEIRQLMDKMSF